MTGACDATLYIEDADLGRNVARIPELVDSINIQATGQVFTSSADGCDAEHTSVAQRRLPGQFARSSNTAIATSNIAHSSYATSVPALTPHTQSAIYRSSEH